MQNQCCLITILLNFETESHLDYYWGGGNIYIYASYKRIKGDGDSNVVKKIKLANPTDQISLCTKLNAEIIVRDPTARVLRSSVF
jgi:hypothetical protein